MTTLGSIGRALNTVRARPETLAIGLVFALAELLTLTVLALGGALHGMEGWAWLGWLLAQRVLLLGISAVVLPGFYATLRGTATRGLFGTLLVAARRAGTRTFGALLVAAAIALVLGAVTAIVAVFVVLGLDAVLVATGAFDGLVTVPRWYLGFVGAAVVLGLAAGRLPFAFADLHALDGERPRAAWRESARTVVARPRNLLGYAVVRWQLLAIPWLTAVPTLIGTDSVTGTLVVFVGVTAVTRTLLAALHVEVYDATASEGDGSEAPLVAPRRVAVAAVLVLALCTGVGAVRIADVGTPAVDVPSAPDPATDDPATVLRQAQARSFAGSYRWHSEEAVYNESTGEWRTTIATSFAFDSSDRQQLLRYRMIGYWWRTTYRAEGLIAQRSGDEPTLAGREAEPSTGEWDVSVENTYPRRGTYSSAFNTSLDWQIHNRTAERVVYELTDPRQLQWTWESEFPPPSAVTYRDGNAIVVAVDRTTGRLDWFVVRNHYRRTEMNRTVRSRTVAQLSYDEIDVRRPPGIGPPPLWAAFWDLFVY